MLERSRARRGRARQRQQRHRHGALGARRPIWSRFSQVARREGAFKAVLLDVDMPYHHPAYLGACDRSLPRVPRRGLAWSAPCCPLVSSIDQALLDRPRGAAGVHRLQHLHADPLAAGRGAARGPRRGGRGGVRPRDLADPARLVHRRRAQAREHEDLGVEAARYEAARCSSPAPGRMGLDSGLLLPAARLAGDLALRRPGAPRRVRPARSRASCGVWRTPIHGRRRRTRRRSCLLGRRVRPRRERARPLPGGGPRGPRAASGSVFGRVAPLLAPRDAARHDLLVDPAGGDPPALPRRARLLSAGDDPARRGDRPRTQADEPGRAGPAGNPPGRSACTRSSRARRTPSPSTGCCCRSRPRRCARCGPAGRRRSSTAPRSRRSCRSASSR